MNGSARQSGAGTRGPIIIARHGRPALDRTKGPKLDWKAYVDWWAAYEAGGLEEGQEAPQALKGCCARCRCPSHVQPSPRT